MQISYKKLWKLLIDKEILRKICTALECDISDIMEMTEEKKERIGNYD